MKSREGNARFPFYAAGLVVLTCALFGTFVCLVLWGSSALRRPFGYISVSMLSACLGLGVWLKTYEREGREIAVLFSVPYCALLIPAFFFPDYLIGYGPKLSVSVAILVITLSCFLAIRFFLLARPASKFEEWVSRNSLWLTVTASSVFIISAVIIGTVKYFTFGFSGIDLGTFTQSFWTTLHGKLFWNTYEMYPGGSHFGKHLSAVMFLILPFFYIFPHCITLFSLNAVGLGLGGIVIYFLAKDALGKYAGLCFGLSFLMYPGISYRVWNPYYFMHYAPLFLLLALYYFKKEKLGLFCLFLVLACSVREGITLTTFMFGIYALLRKRKAVWVLTSMVLSAVWFAMAFWIVIPSLGPGTVSDFFEGTGIPLYGILQSFFHSPVATVSRFLSLQYLRLVYLVLMPLAIILPLLGLEFIFALPTLLIIGLSSREQTRWLDGYYYMPLIPFIFASSVTAVKRISLARTFASIGERERVNILCTYVLFLSLAVFVRGPLSQTLAQGITRPYNVHSGNGYNDVLRQVIRLVPANASVFAPRYIMPHIAKRAFVSPGIPYDAEYLIVDLNTEDALTARFQKTELIEKLDMNTDYVKLFEERGVKLYKKKGK